MSDPTPVSDEFDLNVMVRVVKVHPEEPNCTDGNVMDALHAHLVGEQIEVDADPAEALAAIVLYEVEDVVWA